MLLSNVKHSAIKTFYFKEVKSVIGVFHNYCGDKIEANSKDNSENALICSLLGHSTFFLWLFKVTHSAINTFNLKAVESRNGVSQNQCSDKVKTHS